ncbi:histidine phosphatase family protein [Shewanella sp. Isolate11]|uniref:histidine phosphatase family protein n=1 Tax=Shewanella sp. Isolate11 TaxID=2908530 RepID=UPI001EFD6A9D|nr:histidine phosphatase family protein [Shewanella sp. Isolate11]MCG9697599.1 histidine phosphatase family protein [Shewanella sp. Isolate11]
MTQTTFYLMRHGECEQGDLLRGHVDVPLSELGFARMQLAYAKMPESVEVVVSSPLLRCQVFAEHLDRKRLNQQEALTISCDDRLKEIYFGDWDGLGIDELYSQHEASLTSYWDNPWQNPLPGAETMQAFESRVDQLLEQLVEQHAGKKILLITHGGVIRHLMAKALGVQGQVGFYTQLSLNYASVVKISHYFDKQASRQGSQSIQSHWRLYWGESAS